MAQPRTSAGFCLASYVLRANALSHCQDNSARPQKSRLLCFTPTPWNSFALRNHVEVMQELRRRQGHLHSLGLPSFARSGC